MGGQSTCGSFRVRRRNSDGGGEKKKGVKMKTR